MQPSEALFLSCIYIFVSGMLMIYLSGRKEGKERDVLQPFLLFLQDIYTYGLQTQLCGEAFLRIHMNELAKSHCHLRQLSEKVVLRKCGDSSGLQILKI